MLEYLMKAGSCFLACTAHSSTTQNILHVLIFGSGPKLNVKTKLLRECWGLSAEDVLLRANLNRPILSHQCHDSGRAPVPLSQTVRGGKKFHVMLPLLRLGEQNTQPIRLHFSKYYQNRASDLKS